MHWIRFLAFWQKRAGKSWKNAGEAINAFDLAHASADYEDILSHYPDVLLFAPSTNIVIGTQGIWIEGTCVSKFPAGSSVALHRDNGKHYLHIGEQKISVTDDTRGKIAEIRRWIDWYFRDFLPNIPTAAPAILSCRHPMWQLCSATCPECGKNYVPCPGDLGAAID